MEENEKKALQSLRRELQEIREDNARQWAALTTAEDSEAAAKKREEAEEAAKLRRFLDEQDKWLNEYVEIRLFRDNERYRDDVYVAVNGQNCVIRRGVWTRVRRKFALLLDQSEIQDMRTAELMEREEGRFASESSRRLAGAVQ